MVRKLFYIAGTIAFILIAIVIIAFLYGVYQAGLPPKLEVKSLQIDSVDGYPSIIVEFSTDKYGFVFKLFDERGELVDMKIPSTEVTRISLSLVGLKPYTSIMELRTYILKAFYDDKEVYSETITINGASAQIKLLNYTTKLTVMGLELESLIIEVANTGDAPLYLCEVACTPPLKVYIDGEEAPFSIGNGTVIVKPGEKREVRLELLPVTIKKSKIDIEVVVGRFREIFTISFEEFFKPIEVRVGEVFAIGDWEITVAGIKEAQYLAVDDRYYSAKQGMKIVVVRVKVKNVGVKEMYLSNIWGFTLITTARKGYEPAYTFDLEPIFWPSPDVVASATKCMPYSVFTKVSPGTWTEFDLLFQIPQEEEVAELGFKVGIPAKEVRVKF